ncbi:hypothetical protein ABT093_24290 [Kitasatospora sp. NPDC002551]|uniref:hypothetical protein n=1 Tax=Kitasatospora sp. NPDC002551 TaxID=3154539 RepID=UPI00331F0039
MTDQDTTTNNTIGDQATVNGDVHQTGHIHGTNVNVGGTIHGGQTVINTCGGTPTDRRS